MSLAEKAGLSRGTIVNLKAGKDARVPTIRQLAATLGVEPEELTGQHVSRE
jgi:hypothetical protein